MTDKPPILITGMHRSGTSMVTRSLHESGLRLVGTGAEDLIDAADDNPEGFWENKAVVACNDELLEATGGSWDNPPQLPPVAVDDPRIAPVVEACTAALAALRDDDRWGFKDPRACLTAAFWLDLEPDLRFVICVRHPVEVALSLKRRNQNSYSLGLSLWERYYTAVLDQVPAERRIVTHYDASFADPEGELARLCAFAGLVPAPPRVRDDLRHHTTSIDLGDAGVGHRVRSLYASLCREAGVAPPPDRPEDEGRVRRLILDGAVAQRHADQRQEAVDRLRRREDEFRAAHARAETELRDRIRALEHDRAARETAHREKVRDLESRLATAEVVARQNDLAASLSELGASLARIDQRTQHTVARQAARYARAATRRLPPPAQQSLRRGRSLARRAVAEPGPTARTVEQRLRRQVRARADRLPPPAGRAVDRTRATYRRAAAASAPVARSAVVRLPDPAQRLVRKAWLATGRVRRSLTGRDATAATRPAPTPKGPPFDQWKDRYASLVTGAWDEPTPWLAVAPGSPAAVRDVRAPGATPFPETQGGRPFADDLAHIAHLEALRYRGHRHLVVPNGSRPWFQQQAELRDHVVRTYAAVVDDRDGGLVFDLGRPVEAEHPSLRAAVDALAAGRSEPPAVLDWTGGAVSGELLGLPTMAPITDGRLPYVDGSIDVVVVTADRDRHEARRVARLGVVTVEQGGTGTVVVAVDGEPERPPPAARALVWTSPGDPRWEAALAERAGEAGAALHLAPLGPHGLDAGHGYDVVVAVEPYLLPLPGTLAAAAAAAAAGSGTAVTGKVVRSDGNLESAGGTVFFDRSVGLIAGASAEVRAPWHDYVRPVCWAPGLLAATAGLWDDVAEPAAEGRAYLREWCAGLWQGGRMLLYDPALVAVRVDGDGDEPSGPVDASAWQRVLDLRPNRPAELGDGAWRYLLAHDDVEACRG